MKKQHKAVRCINDEGYKAFMKKGDSYEVVSETKDYYKITLSNGKKSKFPKRCFEEEQ